MPIGDNNDQNTSALEGAGSGALAGGLSGGPWGALAGGVLGGVSGYLAGNKKGYSLPWDQYNQRLSQISNYSNQLDAATNTYANAIGNMYNTAYNQYLPNAAAQFAGRGLNVDSGAFGAELGRVAAMNTASMTTDIAKQRISNINSVDSQYGNAWADMFGAANKSNEAGWANSNANMAGIGRASVAIGSAALRHRWGDSSDTTNGTPPSWLTQPNNSDFNYDNPWKGASEGFN